MPRHEPSGQANRRRVWMHASAQTRTSDAGRRKRVIAEIPRTSLNHRSSFDTVVMMTSVLPFVLWRYTVNLVFARPIRPILIALGLGLLGGGCLDLGTSPNQPTGSSGMGGSGTMAAGGGGMGGGGMGAGGNGGGNPSDPCAGLPTQNVIYVHGLKGDDAAGTGACEQPFKTIRKAHSVAASLGVATTIHLAGAMPPIVYSAQTNGEDTEIQLTAKGLTLEGEGMDQTVISGGDICKPISMMATCAVGLIAPLSFIRNLHITSTLGSTLRASTPLIRLENVRLSDAQSNSGLYAQGSFDAFLTNVHIEKCGASGIFFGGTGTQNLTMTNCTITGNQSDGVHLEGDGTVTSKNNSFLGNKYAGINVQNNAKFTSTGDTFELNANGLVLGSVGMTGDVTIDSAKIQKNLNRGIQILNVKTFKLRNSLVLGNGTFGIETPQDDATIDLGRMADPGKNILQSSDITIKNIGTGVCFTGAGMLSAYGNTWSTCPPTGTMNMPCGGATDFGATQGSLDAVPGCMMVHSSGTPF